MQQLQKELGYNFKNEKWLVQALTTQNAIQEKVSGAAEHSYQTLEFLGDAALQYSISKILKVLVKKLRII